MTKVVVFCDRCGREITDKRHGWLSHKIKYSIICFWNPDCQDGKWRYEEDKALCPQCEEDFVQWYKKGAN